MIEVKITYSKKTYKSGRELFIYKDVIIKGHASEGDLTSTKCCAGVTAITCGLMNIFDRECCDVTINKGLFTYHMKEYNNEINYAINALVYQLDSISMIYPKFFKDFIFIEEKNDVKTKIK